MFPRVAILSLSHSKSKPILTHTPAHPAFYGIQIDRFNLAAGTAGTAGAGTTETVFLLAGASPSAQSKGPAPLRRLALLV